MRFALLVAIGLAPALALGCANRGSSDTAEAIPVNVTVQVARLENLRNVVAGPGTVSPISAGDWTISAPETGRVLELPKKAGDEVKPGDVLVRFDFANLADDLAARTAEVASAAVRLDNAKTALAKMSAMYDR